ncbi:hypothetical protein SASPL_145481 [Salvia splendens]|uniref:7-dehydrocholesterol reductase n=1 Tax=Salvia splendens TaxID=180675 RepID=A0A8X8WGL2_SALSN|nr:hypothetical protein SASPL_145481 [Salvia splendens]
MTPCVTFSEINSWFIYAVESFSPGSQLRKMGAEADLVHAPLLITYASMLSLCPPFVILLWYTMVHADGSVLQTWDYLRQHGQRGLIDIWPNPTVTAWKIIACYAAFEATLQLLLPRKRPNGVLAYVVTILASGVLVDMNVFGIFNPTIVYDHLGEIFSALIFGSFVFCIFLYIKGHVAPSSTDSGSSGNLIIDFYWGMELYPRIGKNFDIKVFTNCRFGMMSCTVLAVTYCIKQLMLPEIIVHGNSVFTRDYFSSL